MIHSILQLTRHKAWWDFKMGSFISTGLLMIAISDHADVTDAVLHLGFLLCAIITGAVYASLINDYNDLESDRMNNRQNAQKDMPRWLSLTLICLVISVGMGFAYSLRGSFITLAAYFSAWLAFTLYDIRPMYFKNRGIWGALADSSGAHLFPTLFIGFGMQSYLHTQTDSWAICALAFSNWAFGFRSIVSHQYEDLHNDRESGLRTFAVLQNNTKPVKWLGSIIFSAEIAALVFAFVKMQQTSLLIMLGSYIILAVILSLCADMRFVTIKDRSTMKYRRWMDSYYQSVMPLVLLGSLSLYYPWMALSIPVYIALFPIDLKIIRYDISLLISTLGRLIKEIK
jgi:4-hydroxybenzoate polyprenyltransferase